MSLAGGNRVPDRCPAGRAESMIGRSDADVGRPRARLPADDRSSRSRRAGPAADPRGGGRHHGPGHHTRDVRLGMARLSAVLRPARRRPPGPAGRRAGRRAAGRGTAHLHGVRVGAVHRPAAARVYREDAVAGWPTRSVSTGLPWTPGTRRTSKSSSIRATPTRGWTPLRSSRSVRVELDGVVLAETTSAVMVFETGLPTRYYVPRTSVRFEHLLPTGTVTEVRTRAGRASTGRSR